MKFGIVIAIAALALTACQESNEANEDAASADPQEAAGDRLVDLWRLDCGTVWVGDLDEFSDEDAYPDQTKELTDSCYLIRHGEDYLLWDTGLPKDLIDHEVDRAAPMDATMTKTLVDQLALLNLTPADIGRVGVSHYHFDHVGQLGDFPGSTLLIGDGDWAELTGDEISETASPEPFAHWVNGDGQVQPVSGDLDIFGDGSVTMLATPGHTPGHHSLLVRFPDRDPIMLTGDLAHFRENYESNGVPDFNADHDATVASLEAFKRRASDLGAAVIIQHEPGDVDKLPFFPEAAF